MTQTSPLCPPPMSKEALQSWHASGPGYRADPGAPALRYAHVARALWQMDLVPILANPATGGRFGGAAQSCPVRSCAGIARMLPNAASLAYRNPNAIENIFCIDGGVEVDLGPDLACTLRLGRYDMLSVPANVLHRVRNAAGEPAQLAIVLNGDADCQYPAVFLDTALPALPAAADLMPLNVSFDAARGATIDSGALAARVSRFEALVPYKKALKGSAGIPPEATEMLSAGAVYPLIVPAGHVGRSRTAPMYGNAGLYLAVAECASGNDGPPTHSHSDTQENFLVLDGRWRMFTGFDNESAIEAAPGDLVAVPPRRMRTFANLGGGKARLFVIIQGPEDMNDTVSFRAAVGDLIRKRFGSETIEAYRNLKMTFDAEARLADRLSESDPQAPFTGLPR